MAEAAIPAKLERVAESGLQITWSDDVVTRYTTRQLRDACPCATCREKRSAPASLLPVLSPAELAPLRIEGMLPVGNYAYAIKFSDGHDTGIFTFELLRQLGQMPGVS